MHVIILGCGRVGAELARVLDAEGHDVYMIDKDPTAFHLLGNEFQGHTVAGVGFDRDVLKKAGIDRADAFIAVSSGDNSNIVASVTAKDTFRVPRVITRIYDPRRAEIYRHMGIPTVSPVAWGTSKIKDLLTREELYAEDTFGNGEVELVEFRVPLNLVGRTVGSFVVPGEINIVSLERLGQAIVPLAGTTFERDDIVHAAVLRDSMDKFKKMFFI